MKQINVVAFAVLRRRIMSFSYYWMIFAPILVAGIFILFNNYFSTNKSTEPNIAVIAPKNIKTTLEQMPAKTYKISKSNITKKQNNPGYLSDFGINGVLSVNSDMTKIKYIYYSELSGTSLPKELKNNITMLHSFRYAASLGVTQKQWKRLIQTPYISIKNLSNKNNINSQTVMNFSMVLNICSFFILTSYISIVGSEIGKEKGNHLLASILSSISAKKHFAGKLLGITYLIIFQLAVYGILFVISKKYIPTKYFSILDIGDLNSINNIHIIFSIVLILVSMILFILLTALLSSLVSKNEDISQVTGGIGALLFIPYILGFVTQENSNMVLVKILSIIPFFNQDILPIRLMMNHIPLRSAVLILLFNIIICVILYKFSAIIYKNNAFNYEPFKFTKIFYKLHSIIKR